MLLYGESDCLRISLCFAIGVSAHNVDAASGATSVEQDLLTVYQ